MKLIIFLSSFIFIFYNYPEVTQENEEKATVLVECSNDQGAFRRSELYNNNSLLRVPRKEVTDKYLQRFGKTKIMRCWLTINDYWHPKNNTFDFDFPVGWGFNLWTSYYDYLNRFSAISEEVLLNVRGNHELVVKGEISMADWKMACKKAIEHYKRLFPNIKYIEALNEYAGAGFGGLTHDQYYLFYKTFYEIVNEINAEMKPAIPLLIGGPCIMGGSLDDGSKKEKILAFLDNYVRDTSSGKKLDFLSYHQYNDTKEDPSTVLKHEELIDSWLSERGLSPDIPVFINEMGCFSGSRKNGCVEEDLLITACNIASLFYYYNQQKDMQGFHWVIQHKTNDRKTQILDDLRWTPYGISLLMQGMHKDRKIETITDGIKNGQGVYAEASLSDSSIVLQLWNYQWINQKSFNTEIIFKNLPSSFRNKKVIKTIYLLDEMNNNFLNSDAYYWQSDPSKDVIVSSIDTISITNQLQTNLSLRPNAMAVIELSVEK